MTELHLSSGERFDACEVHLDLSPLCTHPAAVGGFPRHLRGDSLQLDGHFCVYLCDSSNQLACRRTSLSNVVGFTSCHVAQWPMNHQDLRASRHFIFGSSGLEHPLQSGIACPKASPLLKCLRTRLPELPAVVQETPQHQKKKTPSCRGKCAPCHILEATNLKKLTSM